MAMAYHPSGQQGDHVLEELMSFKQELERRKARKEQAAQQQADQQQMAIAQIEKRAADVAQHLKKEQRE
jgi:hypothetical protein